MPQYHAFYVISPSVKALEHSVLTQLGRADLMRELSRAVADKGKVTGPMGPKLIHYQRLRLGPGGREAFYHVVYSEQKSTVVGFGDQEITTASPLLTIDDIEEAAAELATVVGEKAITIVRLVPLT